MSISLPRAVSPAWCDILMGWLMALSPPFPCGVPSSAVRTVVRGGAQILAKLGIGGLRPQLKSIEKSDEWEYILEELGIGDWSTQKKIAIR